MEGIVEQRVSVATDVSVPTPSIPLVFDIDGTIVQSDLLWECLALQMKRSPLSLLLLPLWLLRGKVYLKRRLASAVTLPMKSLTYRSDVLRFMSEAKAEGREVVIASAAESQVAGMVAEHIGGVQRVYASNGAVNLKGAAKAKLLCETFGDGRFDYVGDSKADLAVWKHCRNAYVVGSERFAERAAKVAHVEQVFPAKRAGLKTWIKALRGHHWAKNVLLFVPLLLAHHLQSSQWLHTLAGFVLFGLCASSLYIVNDVLDLHSDRGHPWKSNRPIASGDISIASGLAVANILLVVALACAFMLRLQFGLILLGYIVLTMWYSAHLKRVVLLDAFVLSSFYTVRVWAGGIVASVPLSQWFLAFSMFFFLSLAIAKRYSELVHAAELVDSKRSGRGYRTSDRELLGVLGVASSFSSILILALYVQSSQVTMLYRRPGVLMLICPILLYWTSRVWLQAYRGELTEDPVTLAMRDRASYFVGALIAAIGVAAL